MTKNNKIPVWAKEFLYEMERLKKKAPKGQIYDYDQFNLNVLKKTGRGNCIAISRLFIEILRKYNVDSVQKMDIGILDQNEDNHRIILVYQTPGRIWLQSNDKLICFKTYHQLMKYAGDEWNWTDKGLAVIKQAWISWC